MKLDVDFDISRNFEDYEGTRHLRRRMKERVMLDTNIIQEAIEDGEVVEVADNSYEGRNTVVFELQWLSSTFRVVTFMEDRKVHTAYEVES